MTFDFVIDYLENSEDDQSLESYMIATEGVGEFFKKVGGGISKGIKAAITWIKQQIIKFVLWIKRIFTKRTDASVYIPKELYNDITWMLAEIITIRKIVAIVRLTSDGDKMTNKSAIKLRSALTSDGDKEKINEELKRKNEEFTAKYGNVIEDIMKNIESFSDKINRIKITKETKFVELKNLGTIAEVEKVFLELKNDLDGVEKNIEKMDPDDVSIPENKAIASGMISSSLTAVAKFIGALNTVSALMRTKEEVDAMKAK